MDKLKFKYKIEPHRSSNVHSVLHILEQDDVIVQAGRLKMSSYSGQDIFTAKNGWKIGIISSPCVDQHSRIIYLIGTSGNLFCKASVLKTQESEVVEALEDFRVNYCKQDLVEPQHKLTRVFL